MRGTKPSGDARPTAAIVGAGVAGLACAVALADRGVDVTVFEREAAAGGRAASFRDPATGDTIDVGPHVLHTQYVNMLGWLDRLGTRGHIVWQRRPFITMFDHGTTLRMPMRSWPAPLHGLAMLPQVLRIMHSRDALSSRRVVWQALATAPDGFDAFDDIDALTGLRDAGVTPRAIDWFWRSAVLATLAVPLERCSMAALLALFRHGVGHSPVHFGLPSAGLADAFVPAAVRAIEDAGGRVRLRARVIGLARAATGDVDGVVLEDGPIRFDRTIVALPPAGLASLASDVFDTTPFAFEPCPYVSTYLWFDRKVTRERFWGRVFDPRDLNTDFYDLSNIRAGWRDRPSVIASNAIHAHRATELAHDAIVQRTVDEIAEFAPAARDARVVRAVVHRIPMAVACPLPGTQRRRPLPGAAGHGLFLAGDWMRTGLPCTMESATRSGFLAAEAVLASLDRPARVATPVPALTGLAGIVERRIALPAARRARAVTRGAV